MLLTAGRAIGGLLALVLGREAVEHRDGDRAAEQAESGAADDVGRQVHTVREPRQRHQRRQRVDGHPPRRVEPGGGSPLFVVSAMGYYGYQLERALSSEVQVELKSSGLTAAGTTEGGYEGGY